MIQKCFKLFAIISIIFLITACEKKISHEHQEVHWDRDMCDRCRMVISERKHSVQIINKELGKAYKFDDIGCAISWFKEEKISWKDNSKIWITDVNTKKWIDARTAFYDTSHNTPMGYGFSANENKDKINKDSEVLNFEEISRRILNRGRE